MADAHLIYVDDSGDEKLFVLSALIIPIDQWLNCFLEVKKFRRNLKQSDGIFVYKELHAWEFVSGRGRISDRIVTKYRRSEIFKEALTLVAALPGIKIMNAVVQHGLDERAFERMLNRINRTMQEWHSRAILICDEGKETAYVKLARRMSVFNPIPSMYGQWGDSRTKNIPTDLIVEDPIFKQSGRSYLIQMADFCAYSLLRRERPIASKTKYGLDKAFNLLRPALFLNANYRDREGIIRM